MPVELNVSTVTDIAEVVEPPAGGVTGFGVNVTVTPLGVVPIHEPVSVTASLKLPVDATVIVEVSELPVLMDIEVLDDDTVNGVEGMDESVKVVLLSAPSQCNRRTVVESVEY